VASLFAELFGVVRLENLDLILMQAGWLCGVSLDGPEGVSERGPVPLKGLSALPGIVGSHFRLRSGGGGGGGAVDGSIPVSISIVTGMHWNELIDAYLVEIAERGRRSHTLRGYRTDLVRFVDQVKCDVEVIDGEAVVGFVASLDGMAPATRARRRSAVGGFLRWAAARGVVASGLDEVLSASGPALATKRPRPEAVRAPKTPDVEAVLAVIPRQADRDQLLFGMLARLGLRPGEALALQVEDFHERDEYLHVPGWGGNRRRVLVDDPQVLMRLVNWNRSAGPPAEPMFHAPGRTNGLRYQSIAERWAHYQALAGVKVRLGDLRRFHAAEMLAGGVPEWVVRDRLGLQYGPLPIGDRWGGDDAIRAWRARIADSGSPSASEANRSRPSAG
jgi:integrase/recombinase XerD